MKKEILNKIAELNKKNEELFNKKANLENEILIIDIKIVEISEEYNKLTKKLVKKLI